MKKIGLFLFAVPVIAGCDSTETNVNPQPRATTQYSQTLDHARETADQLEKSLSN